MGLFTTSHRNKKTANSYSRLIAFSENFKSKKNKNRCQPLYLLGFTRLKKMHTLKTDIYCVLKFT
jgi:hypothetical protein